MNMHQIQAPHLLLIFYQPEVNGSTVVRIKCSEDVLAEVFCIATGNSFDKEEDLLCPFLTWERSLNTWQ